MKAEVRGRTANLPDFLIVGGARSGSTSLFEYLRQHPRIFMPDFKEPCFFIFANEPPNYSHPKNLRAFSVWQIEEYVKLFDNAAEGQMLGEASANYLLFFDKVIENIKKYVPRSRELRIIIILRDPVERAYSQYLRSILVGNESSKVSFEDALDKIQERLSHNWFLSYDYIGYGFYYEKVKAYLDNFQNVMVCLYDDLKRDTEGLVKDIFRFLGVDDSFKPDIRRKHNPSGIIRSELLGRMLESAMNSKNLLVKMVPSSIREAIAGRLRMLNIGVKPEMKEETRRYLRELYREDILKLQHLIKRDLSAWLE